jgi:hypothetical protein
MAKFLCLLPPHPTLSRWRGLKSTALTLGVPPNYASSVFLRHRSMLAWRCIGSMGSACLYSHQRRLWLIASSTETRSAWTLPSRRSGNAGVRSAAPWMNSGNMRRFAASRMSYAPIWNRFRHNKQQGKEHSSLSDGPFARARRQRGEDFQRKVDHPSC